MIKLSPRLKQIADVVDNHQKIVDIGCDHGLVDIYLMQKLDDITIVASDVNENALNNAKKNIKKYQLENKITTVLSDGLEDIDTKGLDAILISGMGSHTIVGILYSHLKKLKGIKTLILQSNNDLDFLRSKVTKIGYYIKEERLVSDSGIIYTIIVFKKGWRFYSRKELYFGPYLLRENSRLFQTKNQLELEKLEKFYPLIPRSRYHHKRITYWKIKTIKKLLKN